MTKFCMFVPDVMPGDVALKFYAHSVFWLEPGEAPPTDAKNIAWLREQLQREDVEIYRQNIHIDEPIAINTTRPGLWDNCCIFIQEGRSPPDLDAYRRGEPLKIGYSKCPE